MNVPFRKKNKIAYRLTCTAFTRPFFFVLQSAKFSGMALKEKVVMSGYRSHNNNNRKTPHKYKIAEQITMASICSRIFMNCSAAIFTL